MRAGAFIRQLRAYGELALRQRKNYEEAVQAITASRWKTILEEVQNPAEREEIRWTTVGDIVRNYSEFAPNGAPDEETAFGWMVIPTDGDAPPL